MTGGPSGRNRIPHQFCAERQYQSAGSGGSHRSAYGRDTSPNPFLIAADIGSRTSRIRIGLAVVILPLWHPLRVAENITLLDQSLRGRVEIGFGRASQPHEVTGFNLAADPRNPVRSREIFRESLEIVRLACTEPFFSYQGNHYQIPPADDIPFSPRRHVEEDPRPGYFGIQSLSMHYVRHGYAVLALYPRGQGESVVEWKLDHATKATYHADDRYRYYYRGAFADLVRGVDFLNERPEVDSNRIGTWGMSQGGGFALAIAALDKRIKAASAEVAWPLNFKDSVKIEDAPYGEYYTMLKENPEKKELIMENLVYFDAYNLGKNISCPTLMNAVIIDPVHPYHTIMPVFERLPAKKSIIVYPDIEHGTRADFARHTLDWLDRYIR